MLKYKQCSHIHAHISFHIHTEALARRRRRQQHQQRLLGSNGGEVSRYIQTFEEDHPLGRGAFSTTYRCVHRVDGIAYAVKISRGAARGEGERQAMLGEVYDRRNE